MKIKHLLRRTVIILIVFAAILTLRPSVIHGAENKDDKTLLEELIAAHPEAKRKPSVEWDESGNLISLFWSESGIQGTLDVTSFHSLENLVIRNNLLTGLNVKDLPKLKSLDCSNDEFGSKDYNKITSLDLTGLISLETLECSKNKLTSLDLISLPCLKEVTADSNNLETINATDLPVLRSLDCSFSKNPIEDIKLEGLENLETLHLSRYYGDVVQQGKMLVLDVSHFTKLKVLCCAYLSLEQLTLGKLPDLEHLDCSNNNLRSLEAEDLPSLTWLSCENNQLTSLSVKGLEQLECLYCSENKLTELEVAGLAGLKGLDCRDNSLSVLELGNIDTLSWIDCSRNQFTEMPDIKNLKNLYSLSLADNQLTVLDTSGINLKNLNTLDCNNNSLSSISIENLVNLCTLRLSGNNLTNLSLTNNNLIVLDLSNNNLTNLDLTNLKKLETLNCAGNRLTNLNVTNLKYLRDLNCRQNSLTSLKTTGLVGLEKLDAQKNKLKAIGLTGLSELWDLNLSNNKLTKLTIPKITASLFLSCDNNQLTDLNLSNEKKIIYLDCSNNRLKKLDLKGLKLIKILKCSGNQLTSLNLKDTKKLDVLTIYSNKITKLDLTPHVSNFKINILCDKKVSVKMSSKQKKISVYRIAAVVKELSDNIQVTVKKGESIAWEVKDYYIWSNSSNQPEIAISLDQRTGVIKALKKGSAKIKIRNLERQIVNNSFNVIVK